MSLEKMDPIPYMTRYITGVLQRFGLGQRVLYPPTSQENSLLLALERIEFLDSRRGYVGIFATDSMEYASGSNPSLSTRYDCSRPFIKYSDIPGGNAILKQQVEAAYSGGGYITYKWSDPKNLVTKTIDRYMYVDAVSSYLMSSLYYDNGMKSSSDTLAKMSTDILQQLVSNYLISNSDQTERYEHFLQSIDDGRVVLIDMNGNVILGSPSPQEITQSINIVKTYGGGYIGNSFATQVPFLNYIIWYKVD